MCALSCSRRSGHSACARVVARLFATLVHQVTVPRAGEEERIRLGAREPVKGLCGVGQDMGRDRHSSSTGGGLRWPDAVGTFNTHDPTLDRDEPALEAYVLSR